ncbi:MAG: sulfate transporter [Thiothrix lacustris]|uniref:Sulfate transporter n=1 Tax=Thiothrix lacustris TaxID=525917 RepID=A0A1Y1QSI6_9GAMM|nr:MAG: sulfate transporter [Thiothrix lacustris]
MSLNQESVPDGYMQNALGHLVPVEQVREQDLLRNQTVLELVGEAREIHASLVNFKRRAMQDIADLVAVAAEKYGAKVGGDKGNISLVSFDGKYKITRSMAAVITFTEELQAAKALIEACIEKWSDGADDRIKTLVMRAFKPNTKGELNTKAVLGLMRLEMRNKDGETDAEWTAAMDALKDSIQTSGTTAYVNVYERVGMSDRYQHVPLDLAAVG